MSLSSAFFQRFVQIRKPFMGSSILRRVPFATSMARYGNAKADIKMNEIVQSIPALARKTDPINSLLQTSKKIRKSALRRVSTEVLNRPAEMFEIKAFCTASEYNLDALLPFLQKNYIVSSQYFDDMMHIVLVDPKNMSSSLQQFPHFTKQGEVFIHKNGSFVAWNIKDEEIERIMTEIKGFEVGPYENVESENLTYCYTDGETTTKGDLIYINNTQDPYEVFRDKFAFSHGMVNCVKLGVLENQLENHISSVKHIPEHMMLGEGIPINRKESLKKIGELLFFRNQLNLHSDLIETPDVYWNEPKQEDLYNRVTRILELRQRVSILNRRLDYAKESSEVLRNHLGEAHSHNLEWGIIFLIIIEVVFGFCSFFGINAKSLME